MLGPLFFGLSVCGDASMLFEVAPVPCAFPAHLLFSSAWKIYVPKRHPIVLANLMSESHYTGALNIKNDKNHEVIRSIEKNQGV
jgi:hypothetical protein